MLMAKEIENELLTRGIANIYPSVDFVANKLKQNKKPTIYLGVDPTGPTLHLGHAIVIKKLRDFQKAGCQIILLMGDFTAMIGDPTDKNATRKQLSHKEVMHNLKNYKKQASKLISFTGKNKALFKFNSKWLAKMKFADVLSLASEMTVQQMLERDMFDKRIKEGKPVSIHEFLYPLMQGYDSVAMNVDGEIGGNDQTFNMLCGRNLMKTMKNKEKFVVTMKLLEDNSGKKMGKTENNMLALSDQADEMFRKIMSWTDGMIVPGFELCTDLPMSDIATIESSLSNKDTNPRDYKIKLAELIVEIYYSKKSALEAKENWEKTFSNNEIPLDVRLLSVPGNMLLVDVLIKYGYVSSKTEFRRLVDSQSITIVELNEKILNYNEIPKPGVYRIGKKRFCKIDIN